VGEDKKKEVLQKVESDTLLKEKGGGPKLGLGHNGNGGVRVRKGGISEEGGEVFRKGVVAGSSTVGKRQ